MTSSDAGYPLDLPNHSHAGDMSPKDLARHIEMHHFEDFYADPLNVPVSPGDVAENYAFHEDDHRTAPGPAMPHSHSPSLKQFGARAPYPQQN